MTQNNDEKDFITLEYDDGEEIEYEIEGTVEVKGREYLVLVEAERDDAIEFFRLEDAGNDEEELVPIEDDEEFRDVIAELRECGYDIKIES